MRRSARGALGTWVGLCAFVAAAEAAAQGARSYSKPGHEDLTFWVNHAGLEQIDVEGDVGFGDFARILLRRRSNAPLIRPLRDRFTFRVVEPSAISTPDLFRVVVDDEGLRWTSRPQRFVLAAGRIFNLALLVEHHGNGGPLDVRAGIASRGGTATARVEPKRSGALFAKVVEPEPGPQDRVLRVEAGNRRLEIPITFDVRPLVELRVRIEDSDGQPAAARVYLTGADGLAYAPKGAINRITAAGGEHYFHAERELAIALPAGRTLVEATRGPEYALVTRAIDLRPGHPAEVRLRLRRWTDQPARGWYAGDAHIHANYTATDHQVVTPDDVRLQVLGEDLHNANMVVANSSGAFLHDQRLFEGKPHAASTARHVIYWNEEMRNAGLYGHMCFLGLKTLVEPVYTGFKDTPHWEDFPPNHDLADSARKQGGAVTYAHPGYGATFDLASARELPVDLALGQIDAMDVLSNQFEPATSELWYRLLNCGFHLGISAGTDSFTNTTDHYAPGGGRVYAEAGPRLDYAAWLASFKRGRTFATNGPMLSFTVDGHAPGDEIPFADAHPRTVRVKAELTTQVPVDTVDIVVNGRAVLSRRMVRGPGTSRLAFEAPVALTRSSWIALRATGPWHRLILNDAGAFAHTSPVYVRLGERAIGFEADARFFVDWIDRLIARTQQQGQFARADRKRAVVTLFERARKVYEAIAVAASRTGS